MSRTLLGIVSYGGLPFLRLLLDEIKATTNRVDVCVVVAKPGDQEMLDYLRDKEIIVLRHDQNFGFPASINSLYDMAFDAGGYVEFNHIYGGRLGTYDNLIICGNDIVPMPRAIDAMIDAADTTDFEMVCGSEFNSKFLYEHYPEVRKYFQGPNLVVTEEGLRSRIWEVHKDFRNGLEPDTRKDIRNFTLFKRSAFEKAGYADVNFWPNGYWEDLDACLRLDKTGVRACGLLEAAFYHWWSRTIHQGEPRPNDVYFRRNQELYIHKWGGGWQQERYSLPYDGRGMQLTPEIFLKPELRIADREQEAAIIDYWSKL